MINAYQNRLRERAHFVAVLCQVQGAKVTAADLLGEKPQTKRLANIGKKKSDLHALLKRHGFKPSEVMNA